MAAETGYVITWEDAHGDEKFNIRYGKQAAEFITELFNVGCKLISVAIYA